MHHIRARFRLDWHGLHGVSHWSRVLAHTRHLSKLVDAEPEIGQLFAVLHDVERQHDNCDPDHGARAAEYATWLRREAVITLEDDAFALLQFALRGHSFGRTHHDPSVQVCWDADRLDLGRVGVYPEATRLGLDAARDPDYIAYAYAWAQNATTRRAYVAKGCCIG